MASALRHATKAAYKGPVKAVILDWSGTTADKYVIAPAIVFAEVFNKHKVPITMVEARKPMGLRKDLHIAELMKIPEVKQRWRERYCRDPTQQDVDNLFKDFVPMQLACLRKYSDLIPGTAEAVKTLKEDFKCKIGSTTGFLRSMVDVLLEDAKKQGYVPDATVSGDEVMHGARPKPFMVYKNMDLLDVHPIESVVKVDDTVSGVGEALQAGCWGVGVSKYSNYVDIDSLEHAGTLSEEDLAQRREHSHQTLVNSGAHYVIETIEQLPEVVADINTRLAEGDRP